MWDSVVDVGIEFIVLWCQKTVRLENVSRFGVLKNPEAWSKYLRF